MENLNKYLTRAELIAKLQELPEEYDKAPIVFTHLSGEESSGEWMPSVNVFQVISTKTVDLEENKPLIVLANNPEDLIIENENQEELDELYHTLDIQSTYLNALEEAGIQHWEGYKYFQQIFKDKMIEAGYDASNFSI